VEPWVDALQQRGPDAAWDALLNRYRRVIFAAIRHYAEDYDDVMDVFARVCEVLREDDLRRLRSWAEQREHRARFSTWLVTVVRNITADWFRHREGRRRLSAVAESLPPLRRHIFEHIFLEQHRHVETFELLRGSEAPDLSFRQFQTELRATYKAVTQGRRGHVFRDLGRAPPYEAEPEAEATPFADTAENPALLAQALDQLSPEDRVAVELYVMQELPAEAVARVLGLPNGKAVYNRVYRALAAVREGLEQAGLRREDL
jgi:RNA polymerase sigma factor (sigma-70 family)